MTRVERLRFEALGREKERLRAWLGNITLRARGMGRDLAVRAIHSSDWPDERASRGRKNK